MRFQRETLSVSLFEEMKPLLEKHFHEIAHYQDIPLDPAIDQYLALERAGALRVFTARGLIRAQNEDGNWEEKEILAGYCIFFVRHNLHYQGSLQASQDILFVYPAFRHAGFGSKFISFCDDELRKEGVQVAYHHVKQAHNFGPLLERIGYQLVDLIYGRRLD